MTRNTLAQYVTSGSTSKMTVRVDRPAHGAAPHPVQHGAHTRLALRARITTFSRAAQVSLVSGDATAREDSVLSVGVDDVQAAYALAQRLGYEIIHPLTHEAWGVRRFFVRDPHGNVINIVAHPD